MGSTPHSDWDPRSQHVLDDQIAAYDELRGRCPVAHSDYLGWSLLRHADVMRVLLDHDGFSSVVSRHASVPNGMDPPDHTVFRRIIEPYFGPQRMQDFAPRCRQIAADLVAALPQDGEIELMGGFAREFAVRIQCAFLGWPDDLHEPLRQWISRNHEATLAGDRPLLAAVALEFDNQVRALLDARRLRGAGAPEDITDSLLRERVGDRPLADEEIVSILRNWTVGELGTIASSIGIVGHYLAENPALQSRLRDEPALLDTAIDEILRIHAPLIANRRITTRPAAFDGRRIEAGERVSLIWASANRDEAVFGNPDEFRLDRDPALNLLYGAGIHVCPGAPLARLELRVLMEELLGATREIALAPGSAAARGSYPASGFVSLALRIAR